MVANFKACTEWELEDPLCTADFEHFESIDGLCVVILFYCRYGLKVYYLWFKVLHGRKVKNIILY